MKTIQTVCIYIAAGYWIVFFIGLVWAVKPYFGLDKRP